MKAAAEGNQQILRDITLLQPHLLGPDAVNIKLKSGNISELLDVNVNRPRNMAQAIGQLLGDEVILVLVLADDLDINGRRQAEVERGATFYFTLGERALSTEAVELPAEEPRRALQFA